MKKLVFLSIFVLSAIAQAKPQESSKSQKACDKKVTNEYKEIVEQKDYEFDQISRIGAEYLAEILNESSEIEESAIPRIREWASDRNTIVYEGTTNYMGGTGLDLVFVDKKTCTIKNVVLWYAE
ncbi:MAG: hypothetical protein ACK5WZ_07925 [Pseudobdellovibrionaceae bacterium]